MEQYKLELLYSLYYYINLFRGDAIHTGHVHIVKNSKLEHK